MCPVVSGVIFHDDMKHVFRGTDVYEGRGYALDELFLLLNGASFKHFNDNYWHDNLLILVG